MAAASNVIDLGKIREARQSSLADVEMVGVKNEIRALFAAGLVLAAEHEVNIDDVLAIFDSTLDEITEVIDESDKG